MSTPHSQPLSQLAKIHEPPSPPHVQGFPGVHVNMSLLPYFEDHMVAYIWVEDVSFNFKFT